MTSVQSSDYTDYFVNLLTTHKSDIGLKADPSYGDQQKIPFTPFACVEPGVVRRVLNGTSRRVMVELDTHIIVYHSAVQSTSENLRVADDTANTIMGFVHADATLGGLCIDSLVREIEPGYQRRGTSLFRATMLTIEARQQQLLPNNP